MSKLLDEANAYIARADIGHRDPKKLNEAHRLIVELTNALEDAEHWEKRAVAAEEMADHYEDIYKTTQKEKMDLAHRLTRLRAHLPALKALEGALLVAAAVLRDEWGGDSTTAESLDVARPAIAGVVRVLEGESS